MDGDFFLRHKAGDNEIFCFSDSSAYEILFNKQTVGLYVTSDSQLLDKNPEKRNFIFVLCIKFFLVSGTEVMIQWDLEKQYDNQILYQMFFKKTGFESKLLQRGRFLDQKTYKCQILERKLCIVSECDVKVLRFRFQIDFYTTRQIWNQGWFNASLCERNVQNRVRNWVETFTTFQILNKNF